MTKNIRRMIAAGTLLAAIVAGGGAIACSAEQQTALTGGGGAKDLKHLPPQDPDAAWLVNNVDKYPNVAVLCFKGVALVTTTRDAAGALQHFDALDRVCPGYVSP